MAAVAAAAAVEGGRLLLLLLLVMMPLLLVLRGVRWGKAQYGDEKEKGKKRTGPPWPSVRVYRAA